MPGRRRDWVGKQTSYSNGTFDIHNMQNVTRPPETLQRHSPFAEPGAKHRTDAGNRRPRAGF